MFKTNAQRIFLYILKVRSKLVSLIKVDKSFVLVKVRS